MKKLCIVMLLLVTGLCQVMAQEERSFVFQKNWFSKQMADVFEDLAKKKFLKVEDGWQDIEKKFGKEKDGLSELGSTVEELLYPLWQLSHCVLMNAKEGRNGLKAPLATSYNPWEAYSILKSLMSSNETIIQTNAFFIEKKLPFSMDNIKNGIEKNLIDTVRVVATEEAYDRLIDMVFSCVEISTLMDEREQLAFKSTIQTEEVAKCEKYIAKYVGQNSQHHRLVTMRRDSLAFVQMDTTVTACENYLRNYPQSRYKEEVTSLMHRYAFNQIAHTSKACQAYLDKYPNSAYKKQVGELKVQYAFEEMKSAATIKAYLSFLAEYRHSDYASSHGMLLETQQMLTRAYERKYISRNSSLADLKAFVDQEDIGSVKQYFYNLRYLPTSTFMNGCEGLTGRVSTTHNQHGEDIQEVMVFNQQGLLSHHSHSKSGLSDSFEYVFDDAHGYQLVKKTDNNRGRTVTYTTKYNDDGALSEISGSDGSKIRYSYNGYQLSKVTYLQGAATERTDYYDSRNLVEKSVRSGNTIVYEYNNQGDAISMKKMKGSTVMSTSIYEYEYPNNGILWQRMSQYNDGNYLLTKYRSFELPEIAEDDESSYSNDMRTSSYSGGTAANNSQVFEVVEQMPAFPGGETALMQFLSSHIKYPVEAEDNGIQGRVVCTFVVERNGSISDVRVVKSVDPSLDKEAVRVLKSMPNWIPGRQDGSPVRVKYTTPVTFRLQ